MEYLNFLRKEAKEFNARIIFVALAAGLFNSLLITFVIKAAGEVSAGKSDLRRLLLIGLSLVGFFFCKKYVMDRTSEIVEKVVSRIRMRLADKIRKTNLDVLEKTGSGRLYSAISTHTLIISQSAALIVNALTAVFMVIFASLFVISLSKTAFALTALLFGWLVFYYSINQRKASESHKQCALMENDYFESFNDLLKGFKELKISTRKNDEFFEERLKRLSETTQALKIETLKTLNKSVVLSQSSFFVLLAGILFILPVITPADIRHIPSIIAVVLFIFGPVSEIISVYPFLTKSVVSIRTVYALEEELDALLKNEAGDLVPVTKTLEKFESIECRQVVFSYRNGGGDAAFSMGPVDFSIHAGEIVFVVGGNGSGKSTFLKVLTGLYPLAAGSILLNGRTTSPHHNGNYRELFTPIFSDYHLFDRLYGVESVDEKELADLLELMELDDKTQIVDRQVTNRNLSTGQRKRLALVMAILEKKPIFIFDEWAADQDPDFRRYFYERILPRLKADGHTILAATHDDRYFHAAHRVIKFEYGQIVKSS